jgi:hypothetical protein
MSMYSKIYYNLCESKKQAQKLYFPGSGLHKHHIIPKHMSGTDDPENFTYLTVREHIIAHFLLWKMHKNPNDLRSMKMLGANLSVEYRKKIGEYCRDNKIGFHGASKEDRLEWAKRGLETQKTIPNSFYYWSTKEGRQHRSSLGGKVGAQSQIDNKVGIHNPEKFKEYASLGGKAIKGMTSSHNGKHRTRIRPEKLDEYLSIGYIRGFTLFSDNES